jgi:predicted NBD/HSP70 family sugar kinase
MVVNQEQDPGRGQPELERTRLMDQPLAQETRSLDLAGDPGAGGDVPLVVSILAGLETAYRNKPSSRYAATILKTIYGSPGITRKALVSSCKMRPGTVTEIVAKLLEDNLVYEVRPTAPSERGRPEIALHINKRKWLAIAVFCVSTEMQAVLIDSFENVICSASVEIPSFADNADFEQCIARLVENLLSDNPCSEESRILGISFSVPGIVDSVHRTWVFSARWPKMRNLALAQLQERLGIEVSIRRQLDVRLNYELVRRPELRSGNTLLFYWGYGIGGAFASQGEIVSSQAGVFCQIGHIAINPDSIKPCLCGRLGCLESEAAYWALQPEIARLYSDIVDNNEFQAAGFLKEHAIFDQEFFKKAQKSVAYALSYLQAILVPDHVLLNGMFLENATVQDSLVKRMRQLSPPFVADAAKIEFISITDSWNPGAIAFFDFKQAFEAYIGQSNSDRPPRADVRLAERDSTAAPAMINLADERSEGGGAKS